MKKILLALMMVLVLATGAMADSTATFAWDYLNPPSDLAGFRLYMSDQPNARQTGTMALTIPADRLTGTLSGVADGPKYFVVTAYDGSGNESGPSNEVTKTFDGTAPGSPQNFQVTVTVNVNVQP